MKRQPVRSEYHLMRPIALPQREVRAKVRSKHRLLLNRLQDSLIHTLLILHAILIGLLLLRLLALLEERLLRPSLLALLVLGKVALLAHLVDGFGVHAADVYGGPSSDDIAGIDAAERDAVDLEWAGDEDHALREGLEEHDALAAVAAGEEDEDCAGLEGGSWFVWARGFAGLDYIVLVERPVLHINGTHGCSC